MKLRQASRPRNGLHTPSVAVFDPPLHALRPLLWANSSDAHCASNALLGDIHLLSALAHLVFQQEHHPAHRRASTARALLPAARPPTVGGALSARLAGALALDSSAVPLVSVPGSAKWHRPQNRRPRSSERSILCLHCLQRRYCFSRTGLPDMTQGSKRLPQDMHPVAQGCTMVEHLGQE